MKIIANTFWSILISVLVSCQSTPDSSRPIVNPEDYNHYLELAETQETKLNQLRNEARFWVSKIEQTPRGFTYYQKLGSAYASLFELTGDVAFLHWADSAFQQANRITQGQRKVPNLITLSSLSIKKHDFQSASSYALEAEKIADKKFGALMMQFDAEMELGDFEMAKTILQYNKRMDSFDYLVRLSKYKDYEGNLDSAIVYMEMAQQQVQNEKTERSIWANANLGDMYGHAGRINESYEKYLQVLAQDPTYHYALRGIAWIAYSADRNTTEAKRILHALKGRTQMPDLYLLLAEIAAYEGDLKKEQEYTTAFVEEAQKEKYKGMYATYLADIYSQNKDRMHAAIALAEEEVAKRPTPATYDALAWAIYQSGNAAKAVQLYKDHVEGRTYEPDVIYHMGVVYHQSGIDKGKGMLMESLEASYELGPVTTSQIQRLLKS